MSNLTKEQFLQHQIKTSRMLRELGFPVHRIGYKQLCVAIPCLAQNNTQTVTKELYPHVSSYFGNTDRRNVEHDIRIAINDAWKHRNPAVWNNYFPQCQKSPTNKRFISTLAEHLR